MDIRDALEPIAKYASRLCKLAWAAGDATGNLLQEKQQSLDAAQWLGVRCDYVNIYLILTGRAMSEVDPTKRQMVMETLAQFCFHLVVRSAFQGQPEEMFPDIEKRLLRDYQTVAGQGYGQCQLVVPGPEGDPGGTMIWEFSRVAAARVGRGASFEEVFFFSKLVDYPALEARSFAREIA